MVRIQCKNVNEQELLLTVDNGTKVMLHKKQQGSPAISRLHEATSDITYGKDKSLSPARVLCNFTSALIMLQDDADTQHSFYSDKKINPLNIEG